MCVREREREIERERQRETDRQTDRQTDRHRERPRETQREGGEEEKEGGREGERADLPFHCSSVHHGPLKDPATNVCECTHEGKTTRYQIKTFMNC